ncbi:Ig-like domain repeat protein [Nocardioides sp. Bht2]|uniref:copper amine oxidase n=1 Tax=Nocardioides sp. Bht2 TaxID=3392297 RepID=UPI0039B39F13
MRILRLSFAVTVLVPLFCVSAFSPLAPAPTPSGAGWAAAIGTTPAAAETPAPDCPQSLVEETLANGASWRMCVRVHEMRGLVLEQIEYRPPNSREFSGYKRVLDQLSLAQLNVPYDNGHVQYNDITSFGFGGTHLLSQNSTTCPGEASDVTQTYLSGGELVSRTIPGICVDEVDTGLAHHSVESDGASEQRFAARGTALQLSSLSKISWYKYQQQVTFDGVGTIDVALGATGDVAPGGPGGSHFSTDPDYGWPLGGPIAESGLETHAASHWHNAIWKVDFGIDGGSRQYVEEWTYANRSTPPSLPKFAGTGTRRSRAFSAHRGEGTGQRWFRVLNPDSINPDGHPRSYAIVNENDPNTTIPVFEPELSFTNHRACAEYASMNLNAECPGLSVLDYVAADEAELTDPVAWVNVDFHHVDRDEDQSPMPMHWQRFQLVPRDFFAQSPDTPDQRSCINGAGWIDSLDSPCVATNLAAPQIRPSSSALTAGTLLHAEPGSWNESRTTWTYHYLWYRDGRPITSTDAAGSTVAAIEPTYRVRPEDLGTTLNVRVTASHTGYPSGTADSPGLRIPAAPRTPRRASSLTVAAASIRAGRRPRLSVHVTTSGAVPAGKVEIRRGAKTLTVARLVDGATRIRLHRFRRVGRHRLTAIYTGSSTVAPSRRTVTVLVRRR